jgi:hypothetical protein
MGEVLGEQFWLSEDRSEKVEMRVGGKDMEMVDYRHLVPEVLL